MKTKTIYLDVKQINHESYRLIDIAYDSLVIDEDCPSGLRWKERPRNHFASIRMWKIHVAKEAGKNAGYIRKGYWVVKLFGKAVYAHLIVWMLHNNMEIPDKMLVDHWDADSMNNSPGNLRLATKSQNCSNRKTNYNNISGFKGVQKVGNGYSSRININGKITYLGTFPTPKEAHAAYCEAAKKQFGEFYRSK